MLHVPGFGRSGPEVATTESRGCADELIDHVRGTVHRFEGVVLVLQ
jgi:hypothetical protein